MEKYIKKKIYQGEKRSEVTTMNLNPRFGGECGGEELMAIVHRLVGVVRYRHFNGGREIIHYISDHSTDHKRANGCHSFICLSSSCVFAGFFAEKT